MKAYVLHGINDIRYEEVEMPTPSEKEALIEVKASGICGSDIPRIYKTGAHKHPLILGHEFSGVVLETGKGVDKRWRNKRVGAFPLIPCKKCIPCMHGQYEMCRNYSYLGSRINGSFAEYVAVPVNNLIELPDNVNFKEAAMLEPMAVAVHAMRRIKLNNDSTVVVSGLGTIGMLLTMFLLDAGVTKLFVIGNKQFQKEKVLALGLPKDCYLDSAEADNKKWIMECTGGIGADVFFECVGKNETISLAVDTVAATGQICMVGNPYSDVKLEKQVYWKLLRNQIMLTGTWNSSFTGEDGDDWHYALNRLKQRQIVPENMISHEIKLENLEYGFKIMRDKTEDYLKIMMTN